MTDLLLTRRHPALPIRSALVACVILLAAATLLLAILDGVHRQQAGAGEVMQADETLIAAERLTSLTLETQAATRGFVITREARFLGPWRAARDDTRAASARLLRLTMREDLPLELARTVTARIESLIVDWQEPLIRLAQRDLPAAVARFRTGEAYRRTAEIKQLMASFGGDIQRLRVHREGQAAAAAGETSASAIVLIGCLVIVLLCAALFVVLRIGRPMARLAEAARALGTDLDDVRPLPGGRGAIGALERAFNQMGDRLRQARSTIEDEAERTRQAHEKLDAIVDASPMAIVARDRDGTVTSFNAAAERLYGWPAGSVIGQRSPYLGESDRSEVERLHAEALAGGVLRDVELRFDVPGGARTLRVSVAPLRDRQGTVVGTVTVAEDITEYERARREAAVAHAHWHAAVRNLPGAALSILDEDLRYVDADGDALRRLGVEPADFVGQRFGDVTGLSELVRERLTTICRAALDGDEGEYEVVLADRHFHGRAVPMELADGRRAVMLFSVDVTDLHRSEAELRRSAARLERSNRELEEFAYIASHDLQEPLRKIQAFGERLEAACGPDLDPRAADYLERMRGAAGRMSELIAGLLSYSRVTSHPQPAQTVDLEAVVADVVADLEPAIEEAGAEVVVGPLPGVRGDAVQLRQLFQNLIANAIKFRSPDVPPRVDIAVLDSDEDVVTVVVADNGIGFEPECAERIFRMFERLHGRTRVSGSGIGLAVCRRIVERHGGTITAHGEPGNGARFALTLRVSHCDAVAVEQGVADAALA